MKADDANLLEFLKKGTQFVVPIYQRVYSWEASECERLWDDIVQAGRHGTIGAHFTGSIVYVEKEQSSRTSVEPDLIIDGQQRVTTVTLILAALAAQLEQMPEADQEPVEGFAPRKIRGLYLTNPLEDGERAFKLILSQGDKEALKTLVRQAPIPTDASSRVFTNYALFVTKLADPALDLVSVCLGLKKLIVVDVKLTRGVDHPQLVFEAMNSTGKKLSQADLIRNFVLMDLPPADQSWLYEGYWYPMEHEFAGAHEARFDEFVRHYLTLKTGSTPRFGDIYDAFKAHAFELETVGTTRESLVIDLAQHARWFVAMALGKEPDPALGRAFAEIEQLRATVVYPLLLKLYADYDFGVLPQSDFVKFVRHVISYLFRRTICRIPTNSLNKTFAGFASAIDPAKYVASLEARFLTLSTYKRFPTDQEFGASLRTEDLYSLQRAPYFFRTMENHGRKEEVSTADYTIEHIMPQNENLHPDWQRDLGPEWKDVQARLLHTLGNLTLTGYNPELSDRPFLEKRDMQGGFRNSPLRLNQGLGELEVWNEAAIERRAADLATQAIDIWKRPAMSDELLAEYRTKFAESTGFDWTLTHDILDAVPAGRWTGYHYLGEAVGTAAQAIANHVSKCPVCAHPYRVLTWDGRIADGFAWSDPNDKRDPKDILEAEGVRIIGGFADPEQKLGTEDLLALVEDDA
ncbi:MAG TPA: DUF262 domain-containing protein [Acidimicrobiales bacterium]|nr:DUF262 domain-containing protein [Acidimicrobiales bacterium]